MKAKKVIDFHPKFFETMKNYSREKFTADIMAGIIVGVVAIPLAIAFGIASGVGPTEGLVTAIMAGFLISALGGSKVQIGGPTSCMRLKEFVKDALVGKIKVVYYIFYCIV